MNKHPVWISSVVVFTLGLLVGCTTPSERRPVVAYPVTYDVPVGNTQVSASTGPQNLNVSSTQQVAVEYAQDNIRCNSVAPGVTLTPLVRSAPTEVIAPKIAATPQGRAAEPEEVASLALFLASDEAAHITGGLYLIDGGRSAL